MDDQSWKQHHDDVDDDVDDVNDDDDEDPDGYDVLRSSKIFHR